MNTRIDLPISVLSTLSLKTLTIALIFYSMIGSGTAAAQAETISALIAPPADLKIFDPPESYGPDTLWEKINGQAEFYLPAGFKSLQSQLYVDRNNADIFIEVNIYDMGSLTNAFSVFSLQRRASTKPLDLTPMAYQTQNAIYLVHGPYYVEIISMAPLGERMILLNQLAHQYIKDTPVQAVGIQELTLFPQADQIKGSANLIPKDAFGYDQLDRVYTMAFQLGSDQVVAFISKRKSPHEAAKLANGLYTYYKDFGANDINHNTSIQGARMVEIMGTYELMFSIGNYFAGVHEAPTQKQAERLAELLVESIQK